MLVELVDAVFGYGTRAIVQAGRLELRRGRCLGIFGPNGAGKTTLIRGMCGLLAPMKGSVTRAGSGLKFGYLPQHRAMELHWPMTGMDAASLALSARSRLGWLWRGRSRVHDAMRAMDVSNLASRPFAKLSGGQQQRLLLAGALATQPQVLVLDEPTDGLDVRSRRTLLDVLHQQSAAGLCTVMISHDVEDLLYLADDVAWLHPPDVPEKPSHVELICPEELGQRVTKVQHAV